MDDPRHDEIRRIVQPFFLPRRIATLRDGIRSVVRDLLAPWRDRGEVDLAQELAWPMPFDVFFHLVGLPGNRDENPEQVARRELLEEWTNDLHGRVPGTPHLTPEAKDATAKIQRYSIDMLEERRRNPQNDLVSQLVNAHIIGVPFVDGEITPTSEISGLMMVLFLGGVDSTAGVTTCSHCSPRTPANGRCCRTTRRSSPPRSRRRCAARPRCSSPPARPLAKSPCTGSRSPQARGSCW